MKFTIERDQLVDPLRKLTGIVATSDLVNALAYVRLDPTDSGIMFTATNQNISLTYPVAVEGEDLKACTVPAEKLAQICAKFPGGADICFELSKNGEEMRFSHQRSRYQLKTIDPDEVPGMESQDEDFRLTLPEHVLEAMVRRTSYAMARNDVRYYLLGMLLEVAPERVTAVATDGHRMALTEHAMDTGAEKPLRLIVPEKGIDELARNLGDGEEPVTLHLASNHLEVDLPGRQTAFKTTLVDGKYPDYQAVVPKSRENNAALPRAELATAVERLAPIASDRKKKDTSSISLQFGEEVKLTAANNVGDEGEELFETDYQGEKVRVSLNVGYLHDALAHIDGKEVQIGVKDDASSVLLTDPENAGTKHIIMPMRN